MKIYEYKIRMKRDKWGFDRYYPMVRFGLLGRLGLWGYFRSWYWGRSDYGTSRLKVTWFEDNAYHTDSITRASRALDEFEENFKPFSYTVPFTKDYTWTPKDGITGEK